MEPVLPPSRIALALLAVLTVGAAALPWSALGTETVQPSGLSAYLSQHQRAMLLLEYRSDWHSMSREEHRALRNKLRDEFMALTPEQREKRRAELQAQWDALPGIEKMVIDARIQRWQDRHARKMKRRTTDAPKIPSPQ